MSNNEEKLLHILTESCHKVLIQYSCKNSVIGITVCEGYTSIEWLKLRFASLFQVAVLLLIEDT